MAKKNCMEKKRRNSTSGRRIERNENICWMSSQNVEMNKNYSNNSIKKIKEEK